MRARPAVFIDSSLLVLLVVGRVGLSLITKHRRLRDYTHEDYDVLASWLGLVDRVLVIPNVLTETSNLLSQHADPERARFFKMLRFLIQETEEIMVASVEASGNDVFERLGLTDAALLQVITREAPLMTVDFDLYIAAQKKEPGAAINFNHLRQHL